ncbi:unnamed protein product [Heterobilharzia americana]|nr:unnamed protein product [Heterobilharzia americana]
MTTNILESPVETEKPDVQLTPRRAAAEKALAATRRSSVSPTTVLPGSSSTSAETINLLGAKVTILESRDRVGGRIWTYRKNGYHAELGAMVVTGLSANPVTVLVRQLSLNLVAINTDCSLYDPQGHLVNRDVDERIEEEFNRLLGTSAYVCHSKGLDSLVLDSGVETPLSLGQIVELLIKYQEKHKIQLRITHRKLISQLLDRKNSLLDQMVIERKNIEAAYEKWHAALSTLNNQSTQSTVHHSQRSKTHNTLNKSRVRNDSPSCSPRSSSTEIDVKLTGSSTSGGVGCESTSSSGSQKSSEKIAVGYSPSTDSSQCPSLPVFNVSAQFEVRRLLSDLHEAWKKFEPLQNALTRVNKQLDILIQQPPKDTYLTSEERSILDWHLANLEFANATELHNLSLRHWDQDDLFELNGDHCVLQDGYGSVADSLAQCITSGQSTLSMSGTGVGHVNSSSSTKQRDNQTSLSTLTSVPYKLGPGHIELKSAAKRISYSNTGVRVDVLNTAFSQDDLIEYEADALICTLPLGILKESIRQDNECIKQSQNITNESSVYLTKLTAPPIRRLGFGLLNKVVLIFEKCFWDRSHNLFGHINGSTNSRGELFLFWSITDKPVLIALVAGRAACDLENEKNSPTRRISPGSKTQTLVGSSATSSLLGRGVKEPIVGRAMQILRGIFSHEGSGSSNSSNNNCNGIHNNAEKKKAAIPNPIDAYVSRWNSDPDSRGSYSYVAVGASGADYDILGEPVSPPTYEVSSEKQSKISSEPLQEDESSPTQIPRIFFAGEHTCRCYPATVHGALLSGLREAARVANSYFPGQTPIRISGFKLNIS